MRPAPRSESELLAWAASVIQKEQRDKTFGTVTIHFEEGTIVRAKVERSEMPPPAELTARKSRQ